MARSPSPGAGAPPTGRRRGNRPDLRKRYIDLLEYLYGPILVAVIYGYVFAFADPAQEILISLAADFTGWAGTILNGIFFNLIALADPIPPDRQTFIIQRAAFSLVTVLAVPLTIWITMRGILDFYQHPKDRPRDLVLTLTQVAIWGALAAGPLRAALSPDGEASYWALILMATPGLLGVVISLALLAFLTLRMRFAARIVIWARNIWRAFRVSFRNTVNQLPGWLRSLLPIPDPGDILRNLVIAAALIVGITIYIGIWDHGSAERLGPVGISSVFACLACLALGTFTALSYWSPGRLPLIILALGLIGALTSLNMTALVLLICAVVLLRYQPLPASWVRGSALVVILVWLLMWQGVTDGLWSAGFARLIAIVALVLFAAPHFRPARITWGRRMGFSILAAVALFYGLAARYSPACDTLPGCNMVAGVPGAPVDEIAPGATTSFTKWFAERDGPVRLVAAQGGGLYAAYHTAYYLATRADMDTDFPNSIYAISGVSGGSVGAGVYWAIRDTGICPTGGKANTCHRDAVRAILRHDFLSPALAGLFFRDNLDNIMPISAAYPSPIDRGNTLERSYREKFAEWAETEAANRGVQPANDDPLSTALTLSWQPAKGMPLLLFNTTDVATGGNQVLSPLKRIRTGVSGRLVLPDDRDLTVANGMVTSARFPLVTPPIRVRALPDNAFELLRGAYTRQLVDGGYFDNSGIETLMDFLPFLIAERRRLRDAPDSAEKTTALRRVAASGPIEVIVFSVREIGIADTEVDIKGTVGAPLSAFTNAWRARRDLTAYRLETAFQLPGDTSRDLCVQPMELIERPGGFTVSWFLAETTFNRIEEQIEAQAAGHKECS